MIIIRVKTRNEQRTTKTQGPKENEIKYNAYFWNNNFGVITIASRKMKGLK